MSLAQGLARHRHRRLRRRHRLIGWLVGALLALVTLTLVVGQAMTPPVDVLRVLAGEDVPGASFAVGTLRLPRAVLALLAGLSFGLGGAAFQVMLRNPLASPDIIGISSGASAAAVFGIVVLGLDGPVVPVLAVAAGLGIAMLVYGLSFKGGVAGTRLILVGIGVSAMLESVIAYVLSQAPAWTLQDAMRWLTGSVNGARLEQALPVGLALVACDGPLLLPAALIGGILVLAGDYAGQFLLPARYPVGVVTGALGAPYLLYLIVRVNRGGAL